MLRDVIEVANYLTWIIRRTWLLLCLFGFELAGVLSTLPLVIKLHVNVFHYTDHTFGLAGLVGAWSLRAEGDKKLQNPFFGWCVVTYTIYTFKTKKHSVYFPGIHPEARYKTHNFYQKLRPKMLIARPFCTTPCSSWSNSILRCLP